MSKESGWTGRRKFIVIVLAGAGLSLALLPDSSKIFNTPPVSISEQTKIIFNHVLDRTKINIHSKIGEILRDIRDKTYSNGLEFGQKNVNSWESAFIRCDDSETTLQVDIKTDIMWVLNYNPHNIPDNYANNWGDVPEVTCDTYYGGLYVKDVVIDGNIVHTYMPSHRDSYFRWIHFNLATGEVKSL